MSNYRLSNTAKQDLIRIHHYGVNKFGMMQADQCFNSFFDHFERIAQNPYSFEAVDFIKPGYRRCVCGVDRIYYRLQHDVVEIMTIIGRQEFNVPA